MTPSLFSYSLGPLALALVVGAPAFGADGAVLHVPGDHPTIQAAIDASSPGDTVLVADGIYQGAGNRDLRFGGKAITVRSSNGPAACVIDCEGTPTVPFRGFIFDGAETRASVLQGFTVTRGATLPGAVADQFNGGGILIQSSSPTIRDCHFVANAAGCWGGAVYVGDFSHVGSQPANPLIENCIFEANAADDEGGGFFTWGFGLGSKTTIRNSVFIGNSAVTGGGGVTSFGGTELLLDHVTIVGNFAANGSNALIGDATITNSILWSEGGSGLVEWRANEVSYSIVRGGAPGPGNQDVDPRFAADGYHLTLRSPAINAGTPVTRGFRDQRDIDGQPRLLGIWTDIGADEARPRLIRR